MTYIKCTHQCPGGQPCRCNGAVRHTLHLCSDKTCACHQPAAYGMELAHDGSGREFYVPTGTRLAPRKRGGE